MTSNNSLSCPYCRNHFTSEWLDDEEATWVGKDQRGNHCWVRSGSCVACERPIVIVSASTAQRFNSLSNGAVPAGDTAYYSVVFPKTSNRRPVPPEVPLDFSKDYLEACLILSDSPQASAALSRRCLQHILRERAGVKHSDLYNEISEVINSGSLPSHIVDVMDTVRDMGNAASHPINNPVTGQIVPVERQDAEWCLEIIEMLHDFYFVLPAQNERRLNAWSQRKTRISDVVDG